MDNIVEVPMGSVFIAQSPNILTTGGIGSCVAVCLFHSPTKWGALAHVMLPKRLDPTQPITAEDLRYADAAMTVMLNQLETYGITPSLLTAKLVGGASMFPDIQGRSVRVGEKNIETIRNLLSENSIHVAAEEVGGSVGRAVSFDLSNGVVQVKMSL